MNIFGEDMYSCFSSHLFNEAIRNAGHVLLKDSFRAARNTGNKNENECRCGSKVNLSRSKYCRNRVFSWKEEPHVFCFYCCMEECHDINADTRDWGHHVGIVCPYCHVDLFEMEHCNSGTLRKIDDLLMDLQLYRVCRARMSHEECLKYVNNTTFGDVAILILYMSKLVWQ